MRCLRFLAVMLTVALLSASLLTGTAKAATLQRVTSFGNNPGNLNMYLYVPDRVAARPALLVAMHYCTGSASAVFSGYAREYVTAADQYGYIIIFPDVTRSGQCFDVYSPQALQRGGGSDPVSIVSMIYYVKARYPVDTSRIVATGFSSGAMMTNVMLANYPDVFTAGAAFMGVPSGCFATGSSTNTWNSTCANGQSIKTAQQWGDLARSQYPGYTGRYPRMQLWHGVNDTTLRYPNFGEEIKQWTNLNGVSQTPVLNDRPQSTWTRTRYGANSTQAPVEAFSISDAGHDIPRSGMIGYAIPFLGLNATPSNTPTPITPTPITPTPITPTPITPTPVTVTPVTPTPVTQTPVPPTGKFLGNIYYGGREPLNFSKYWNQVTAENEGKWGSVEQSRDQYNWGPLDSAYNYAKSKGYPYKHHNFVWGSQQPSWINSLSAADQRAEVEEWIRDVCARYPDMAMIDVVNEPLHDKPAYRAALGGEGSTGWDWVIWTFQAARTHCGSAKLILNDYGVINSDSATTQYLTIINLLKSRNLIDGVADEGHGFEFTPISTLRNNLNRLLATGVPFYLTEYEAAVADDAQQLRIFQEQIPLFWDNPAVVGVTLWGYVQGQHWKPDGYLLRTDGTERPALTWLMNYTKGNQNTPTPTTPTPITSTPVTPTPVTPTPVTPTPVTPTPGSGACSPVTRTIAAPFTYDGAGTFCWQLTSRPNYINSWNLTSLKINGVDFTNRWANSLPPAINGSWYITYSGQYGWSHFEAR